MTSLADLKTSAFTIGDLLTLEAEQLCQASRQASPEKGTPKTPNASTSLFTQQSKNGYGPGILLFDPGPLKSFLWPGVNTNHTVLLEETISPSIWKTLKDVDPILSYLKFCTLHSHLPSIRSNDKGNELAFCNIGQKLITRIIGHGFAGFPQSLVDT